MGLSHSSSSAASLPRVVLKNNHKGEERSYGSCCEVSKSQLLTEVRVEWGLEGFDFLYHNLLDADIIFIRSGLAESGRQISKREREIEINEVSGTFDF